MTNSLRQLDGMIIERTKLQSERFCIACRAVARAKLNSARLVSPRRGREPNSEFEHRFRPRLTTKNRMAVYDRRD